MGKEAVCTVRFRGQASQGKALLETDALIFRGEFRLAIRLKTIQAVTAAAGVLHVRFPEGMADFDLGPQAQKWAEKILHPPGLLDKLGVKPGAAVSVLGLRDASFRRQLSERTADIAGKQVRKGSDLIFFGAERLADLKRLKALKRFLKPAGAVWVVYPKGQQHIREADVFAAAKAAGLVDVKVVRFSSTHTALRLVIPLTRR